MLPICAKTEQEIAELPEENKLLFLEELGIKESGLDRLIKCSYSLLGLISFLTSGSDEVRAPGRFERERRRPRRRAKSTPIRARFYPGRG